MSYSKAQIFLHWLSAIIIFWATISGFYSAFFDTPEHIKARIDFFNVSITAALIPFFVVRLYISTARSFPNPNTFSQWSAWLAHKFIYLCTVLVLVSGVLMMDRDINIFHILLIPQPLKDPELISLFHTTHSYACMALAILIVLHLAAVIKHHLSGNPILKRMSW